MTRFRDEDGFTLIELLVVILVIGILAAIAIPSFVGQRTRAVDQEAKSVATTGGKAASAYLVDKGSFEGANTAALEAIEPSLKNAVGWYGANAFSIQDHYVMVPSKSGSAGGGWFAVYSDAPSGSTFRICERPRKGGCGAPSPVYPGAGSW